MVLKHILCINVTQIICLFFIHSLNKAFYFQECTLINPSPWCNQDFVNPYLVGKPIIKQSILTVTLTSLATECAYIALPKGVS